MNVACILEQSDYKPGDPAPEGYLAWHEWAEVQHKAGLRQVECGRCGLWRYPQELSDQVKRWVANTRKGSKQMESPICLKCAAPENNLTAKEKTL